MAKPITGKIHVGERRERRSNGDIYVYERVTAYDEKKRRTLNVSQKIKGKIKAGTNALIPTRPKNTKGGTIVLNAECKHTGLTDILEWVGRESMIDHDVRSSLSEGDALKILSIARYWIATCGNTLPRIESWQVMHPLPYSEIHDRRCLRQTVQGYRSERRWYSEVLFITGLAPEQVTFASIRLHLNFYIF